MTKKDPKSRTGCDWHSDGKKVEVVTSYLVLGKAPLVEQVTGVPAGTIRRWKMEPWWAELVSQIQADDDQELDGKLAKRINKVMDIMEDRLENGDFMFNPKSGEFVRRPVSMKDVGKIGRDMFDIRMILRKQKPEQLNQEAVGDILKGLAKEFAEMAKKRVKEKVHVEITLAQESTGENAQGMLDGSELPNGVSEVSCQPEAEKEQSQAEQS